MKLTDGHLAAVIEYVRRCRTARDRRPTLELLEDMLSARDARYMRRALIELVRR